MGDAKTPVTIPEGPQRAHLGLGSGSRPCGAVGDTAVRLSDSSSAGQHRRFHGQGPRAAETGGQTSTEGSRLVWWRTGVEGRDQPPIRDGGRLRPDDTTARQGVTVSCAARLTARVASSTARQGAGDRSVKGRRSRERPARSAAPTSARAPDPGTAVGGGTGDPLAEVSAERRTEQHTETSCATQTDGLRERGRRGRESRHGHGQDRERSPQTLVLQRRSDGTLWAPNTKLGRGRKTAFNVRERRGFFPGAGSGFLG